MPACRRHYPGRTERTCSLVLFPRLRPSPTKRRVSSCIKLFRGLLSVHSRYGLQTRGVAYCDPFHRRLQRLVTSTAAPIATGWSEPVPGRDFHPLKISAFHGALLAPFYPGADRVGRLFRFDASRCAPSPQQRPILGGVEPRFAKPDGQDPVAYIFSANIGRRKRPRLGGNARSSEGERDWR
jgi:hypothetical protein